jgi:hypothetical protein
MSALRRVAVNAGDTHVEGTRLEVQASWTGERGARVTTGRSGPSDIGCAIPTVSVVLVRRGRMGSGYF